MTAFTLLWVPLFYLFWRVISPGSSENSGGLWAVFFGGVAGMVQYMLSPIVAPDEFGLFRALSACVDVVAIPVLLPLVIGCIFFLSGAFRETGIGNFLLLYLMPISIFRVINLESGFDPVETMLVPVIWTCLAVEFPLFIRLIRSLRGILKAIPVLVCLALPFLGTAVYWAFFVQRTYTGLAFLGLLLVPAPAAIVYFFHQPAPSPLPNQTAT
jgi:hypothetical protein